MAFKTRKQAKARMQVPPRHWLLLGEAQAGKSLFTTAMRRPVLTIDADQRLQDIERFIPLDQLLHFSDNPADHTDPLRIMQILEDNMQGAQVGTIVVDSVTSILQPIIDMAMMRNDAGMNKNRVAAFAPKAQAIRVLGAITKWGTDVAWIAHLEEHYNQNAQRETRKTITPLEMARLAKHVNMELHFYKRGNTYAVKIEACRQRPEWPGITIVEKPGNYWHGVPEEIERAAYQEIGAEEMERIEGGRPLYFATPTLAIEWAINQSVEVAGVTLYPFGDPNTDDGLKKATAHATNAYEKVKRDAVMPVVSSKKWISQNQADQFAKAKVMAQHWYGDIDRRLAEVQSVWEREVEENREKAKAKAESGEGAGATSSPPPPPPLEPPDITAEAEMESAEAETEPVAEEEPAVPSW